MQLTTYTDYALRALMYLGTKSDGEKSSIQEISEFYNISKNHLSKVVFELGKLDVIETIRGRNGGIRLSKHPKEINVGTIVRHTESPIVLVECFDPEKNMCRISPVCQLKGVLHQALQAYLQVLDSYTLEDLLGDRTVLSSIIGGK